MYGVGVDLGTSFTAAAVAAAGTTDMVRLGGQAMVTPSVAYLDDAGNLVTGELADRLGLQDPGRAAREFKRRLGDPTPVILGGAPHSPTTLMAGLLRAVLDSVTRAEGGPPDRIVLTHPAVWGPYRREQFAAIPHLAGLPHPQAGPGAPTESSGPTVLTTTEPVAAATYYCSTRPLPPDGLLAVYDLGGGTFDSAVVRNGRNGLEIIGTPEGIEWLGGADFDQALVDHVDHKLGGAVAALDPADPGTVRILAALHRECMLAKEALSTREQAEVKVVLPNSVRHVTVTRGAFEQITTPSLETTVEAFRRTLAAAGITPQDLTAVLLVGGSSQIPLISQMLRDALRRPIMINTHPKHAVALGAAMLSVDAPAMRGRPAPASAVTAARDDGTDTTTLAATAPVHEAAVPQSPPASVRPPDGPTTQRYPPTGATTSAKGRRSRLTVMRLAVALVVVVGLLGVAIAFAPKALTRGPLVPDAATAPTTTAQPTVPTTDSSTTAPTTDTQPAPDADTPVAVPPVSIPKPSKDIYVDSLGLGLAMGIDTSGHQIGWLSADQGILTLRYPDQQAWGTMYVTVGPPVPSGSRPSMDLSGYRSLTAQLRRVGGSNGCVRLGVKDHNQPDDGTETTVPECMTGTWSSIHIPLSAFTRADLTHLYVVFEVVFANLPMTIQLRDIRYSAT